MEFPQKVWKNIVLLHIAGFDFERFHGGPGTSNPTGTRIFTLGRSQDITSRYIYQIVTHKDSQAWPI
jgi:hypothetical protein